MSTSIDQLCMGVYAPMSKAAEAEFAERVLATPGAADRVLVTACGWRSFNPKPVLVAALAAEATTDGRDRALCSAAYALQRTGHIPYAEHLKLLEALVDAGAGGDRSWDELPAALHSLAQCWGTTPGAVEQKKFEKKILKIREQVEEMFAALVERASSVDVRAPQTGWTPLHAACAAGFPSRVLILRRANASLTLTTADGQTAQQLVDSSCPGVARAAVTTALTEPLADAGDVKRPAAQRAARGTARPSSRRS